MNRYAEMRNRHQAAVNALPLKFAFSTEQFERAMRELGLEPTDTDKIYKLGVGNGFYRKTDSELVKKTLRDNAKELEDAIAADEVFSKLMGEEVEPRREFIETNATYVDNLDV